MAQSFTVIEPMTIPASSIDLIFALSENLMKLFSEKL